MRWFYFILFYFILFYFILFTLFSDKKSIPTKKKKKDTYNELAQDEEGDYSHVFIHKNISIPDIDLIRSVENEIEPGNFETDWIDALVVAMDMLEKYQGTFAKRIILITDVGSPSNPDGLEDIIAKLNDKGTKLQILYIYFILFNSFI